MAAQTRVSRNCHLAFIEPLEARILMAAADARWLYAVDNGPINPTASALFTIDAATGATTKIGNTGYSEVNSITFLPDGELVGVSHGHLIGINPATAGSFTKGDTGFTGVEGLAVNSRGTLFGATASGELITIDPRTGHGTDIGSFGNGLASFVGGLAFAPDDTLYALVGSLNGRLDGGLARINPTTGLATQIGLPGTTPGTVSAVFGLTFGPDGFLYFSGYKYVGMPGPGMYIFRFNTTAETVDVGFESFASMVDISGLATRPSNDTNFPTGYAISNPTLLAQLVQAEKYKDLIFSVAKQYGFAPGVLAGLGSRESGWGTLLRPQNDPAGTGDFNARKPNRTTRRLRKGSLPPDGLGFGRGLMQIDWDAHPFARTGNWQDPAANISYAAQVLTDSIFYIKTHTTLTGNDLLRAGLAGYNAGAGNVVSAWRRHHTVDSVTTGRNYSTDVLSRAGWFQEHGFVS